MTLTLLAYHRDPPAMVDAHQDYGRVSRLGLYLMKDRFIDTLSAKATEIPDSASPLT